METSISYTKTRKSQEVKKLILSLFLSVSGLIFALFSENIGVHLEVPIKAISILAILIHLVGFYGLVQFIFVGKEYVFPSKAKQQKSGIEG